MISLEDLDYALPPERIAQEPARPRDAARLLIAGRAAGLLEHRFRDLPELVAPHDLLVVNDTRVVPAKLRGTKASGGRVEALLVERRPDGSFRALVRASGRLRAGSELRFGGVGARVTELLADGSCALRFELEELGPLLDELGEAPLPPYLERPERHAPDLEDYQSVFAEFPGAIAAPTASLHFTAALARRLRPARVTLHVGPGTFRAIRAPSLGEHRLDPEWFRVPQATAGAIERTRQAGGRVIAVGTTVVRALETTAGLAGEGRTDLFILPGHRFRVVDSLITNFHLPRSSLLALVMAFAGVERVKAIYAHAIAAGFRFYSFGDALWLR